MPLPTSVGYLEHVVFHKENNRPTQVEFYRRNQHGDLKITKHNAQRGSMRMSIVLMNLGFKLYGLTPGHDFLRAILINTRSQE